MTDNRSGQIFAHVSRYVGKFLQSLLVLLQRRAPTEAKYQSDPLPFAISQN